MIFNSELNANLVQDAKKHIRTALAQHVERGEAEEIAKRSGITARRISALAARSGRMYADELLVLMSVMDVTFAQQVSEKAGLLVERVAAPEHVELHEVAETLAETQGVLARIWARGGRACHRTLPALAACLRKLRKQTPGILRREAREQAA